MTLQPLPSKFPNIWGKFHFLFYHSVCWYPLFATPDWLTVLFLFSPALYIFWQLKNNNLFCYQNRSGMNHFANSTKLCILGREEPLFYERYGALKLIFSSFFWELMFKPSFSISTKAIHKEMRYVCRCDRTDWRIGLLSGVFYSAVDRHRFDADPDPYPILHFNTDPDPDTA